jgi:hypothetical protein
MGLCKVIYPILYRVGSLSLISFTDNMNQLRADNRELDCKIVCYVKRIYLTRSRGQKDFQKTAIQLQSTNYALRVENGRLKAEQEGTGSLTESDVEGPSRKRSRREATVGTNTGVRVLDENTLTTGNQIESDMEVGSQKRVRRDI